MGKHYSHKNYVRYKADLELNSKTKLESMLPYVIQIANTFTRDQIAIGSLDFNDLIQAGNVGLVEAWNNVDWDRIHSSPNPNGELWSFLKTRIKFNIRREINTYANEIKIPRRDLERASMRLSPHEKLLVNVFPIFFNELAIVEPYDPAPWISLQLEAIIFQELRKTTKNVDHIDILFQFYGIGFDELSQKELAEKYNLKPSYIQKIIERTKNKLKTNEFENRIINFYTEAS